MKIVKSFLFALLAASGFSHADLGTLTFQGTIAQQTCQVAAAQLTRTLAFDDLIDISSIQSLAIDGVAASKNFQFDVTNCPAAINDVGIRFDYQADSAHPNYMAKNASSKGDGVLLGISAKDDTIAKPSGSVIQAASISNGNATVEAKLNAYKVSQELSPGSIISQSTVTVTYN
ncbi:type 1 fimbrial protein [Salmonella enterica]|nr:type 1 fimbrial protein [Salmonella enterica]EGM2645797.1 type 1 fimbrial protein [Salmonella enterica]EGM2983893.1 type 1 fimbrial protein [Salmonella enterica]EJU6033414.1 type 1 fimbrial protein [Salmonella enterica]